MTDVSSFLNGHLHEILLDSNIKSFKIVKEVDGSRKLIGYFNTWNHVSTCINNLQLWNDKQISWCCYFSPNFKNLQNFAKIGNADKSSKTPYRSNFSSSGFYINNYNNNCNKTSKSSLFTKKIT
ncbi:hypothetical protein RCL_jg12562.t1 [Rhizophagus clarus]|uniref:Uncharacterized protein n=1 Tax=Rhizophagus clarus TaxID=94130 RepID=A0A8H3LPW0_9GLOM|nr:hypothetical protein RCL_jg12562.t1 [Rhizophagus clarus]